MLITHVQTTSNPHTSSTYYADEAALSKLDSSIKKNAAFVKRLRQLTEGSKAGLLSDVSKLNLSKVRSCAV